MGLNPMSSLKIVAASFPKGAFAIVTTKNLPGEPTPSRVPRLFKSEAEAHKWLKAQNGKTVKVSNPNTTSIR